MAGESRTTRHHLTADSPQIASADAERLLRLYRELERHGHSYDFFQAVRLIENIARQQKKVGYSVKPADDSLRFGQQPSLAFSPSTIASFQPRHPSASANNGKPRLEVFFFGLFGPNGPLPLHLTEYVRERIRNFKDYAMSAFVDMFHHRLLSFFYRVWADTKPHVNLDRPDEDVFSRKVGSLFGLGARSMEGRDAIPDYAKFHLAGRFTTQSKNAEGLLAILNCYFAMPVKLKQFVGSWFDIPEPERLCLTANASGGALGLSSTLGEKVWECQQKFTLQFGPLTMDDFKQMLPGGASLNRLVALVRNYLGDEYDWDVQLILKKDELKPANLGTFGQLGWTTWLEGRQDEGDFQQLYLNPQQELVW